MMVSPFTFYRGAALLMAADLATTPSSGLTVQLCGDAHLSNFGLFGSAERRLVFDINDFDETHPGPFEWDVKRLVASFEIAGRHRGFTDAERREILLAAGRGYRERILHSAGESVLDAWYDKLDAETGAVVAARGEGRGRGREAPGEGLRRDRREGAHEGSHEGLLQARDATEDGVRIIVGPATHRPGGGRRRRQPDPEQTRSAMRDILASYQHTLSRNGIRSRSTRTCTWRGRWSAWAASAPAPGSCS